MHRDKCAMSLTLFSLQNKIILLYNIILLVLFIFTTKLRVDHMVIAGWDFAIL